MQLLLQLTVCQVCLTCVLCITGHRTGQDDAVSLATGQQSGNRHSSIRRLIGRMLPHRLQGSVELGPAYPTHLDTEFRLNLDVARKWWLGDNVCVQTEETEQAHSEGHDDVSDDGHDLSETGDGGSTRRRVTVPRPSRSDSRRLTHHEVSWTWSSGRRQQSTNERTTNGHQHSVQMMFSHRCVDIARPIPQYRCTTRRGVGRTATVTTTVYECCPGFTRAPASHDGCNVEVRPDLMTSMEKVSGMVEMSRALNVTGLAEVLRDDEDAERNQYTVFAPPDSAFNNYTIPSGDINLSVVRISEESYNQLVDRLNDVISDHVILGRILSTSFVNDMMLPSTLSPDTKRIRINKYPNTRNRQPLLTANCVPFTSVDLLASNGVLHTIERVLPSVEDTIEELASKHPRLTIFSSLIKRLKLNVVNASYTVFAPSDAAFDRLDRNLVLRLLDVNDECALDLIKQHVLPKVLCSSALKLPIRRLFNIVQRRIYVTVGQTESTDDALYVNEAQVIEANLMAINGVVHIIDDVLFTELVNGLLALAKSEWRKTNMFVNLIESSGMRPNIESLDNNFTLFLPTNEALQDIGDILDNMTISEKRKLIKYHIVPRLLIGADLHNDLTLTSIDNSSMLIKEYHSFPFSHRSRKTVQCAAMILNDVNANSVCRGGIGHVINAVLRRPTSSIMHALSSDSQFSRLVELFEMAGLTYLLHDHDSPITLIAPNNEAFDALPAATLRKLTTHQNIAQRVLRSHIIPDVMCCAGVFHRQLLELPIRELNLDGWLLEVDRHPTRQNTVTVAGVHIKRCDLTAVNGVIHAVERFIPAAVQRHLQSRVSGRARTGSVIESIQESIQELLGISRDG